MSQIDFDFFLKWAEDKFDGDVIVSGDEIRINSIFTDDTKHKMWCSPKGGKHYREDGCYRCFKTDTKGTLVGLVMQVEQCSYSEAKEIIAGQTSIRVLEDRLNEFFAEKEIFKPKPENKIKLPNHCYLITEMAEENLYRQDAENYLKNRKIPIDGFYYCTTGREKNRIIIPYYDQEGCLVYWNGRTTDSSASLKYLGPEKSVGVGKGDVLYTPKWAKEGSKIHLTEGEIDAYTLWMAGLHGFACGGKTLSDNHLIIIRKMNYKVCLALDNDEKAISTYAPGLLGMITMGNQLLKAGLTPVTFVRPPQGIKDWNEMYLKYNLEVIKGYIEKYENQFDEWTANSLLFNKI